MRCVGRVLDLLLSPVRRVGLRVFQAISIQEQISGVDAFDFLAGDEAESRLPLVADALEVVKQVSPPVMRRLKTHVRAIIVNDSRTGYLTGRGICVLNAANLESQTPEEVALALVHESAHARIEAAGFSYRGTLRGRIERMCVRAEIRFAERIGDPQLVDRIRKKLDLVWWEDGQMRAVREREWRQWGLPEFLIRIRRSIKS